TVTPAADDDLPDRPAAIRAAVASGDPHGDLLVVVAGKRQRGLRGIRWCGESGEPGTGRDGDSGQCRSGLGSAADLGFPHESIAGGPPAASTRMPPSGPRAT